MLLFGAQVGATIYAAIVLVTNLKLAMRTRWVVGPYPCTFRIGRRAGQCAAVLAMHTRARTHTHWYWMRITHPSECYI